MRRLPATLLLGVLAAPALVQDAPKPIKTERVRQVAPNATTLYRVDDDGTVWIDWRTAETLAALKADRTVLPIAQLTLAIRDGSWRPLPR